MNKSLKFIYKKQREISYFSGIAALLGWDQMTYMPPKGNEERAEQLSLISRITHKQITSEKLYNHLKKLNEISDTLSRKDRVVVTKLYHDIEKARKLPTAFIEKMAKTNAIAYACWREARGKNKFSLFKSYLEKIVELQRQYCDYIRLSGHPYNSLLDNYEEGMTVDILRKEFTTLQHQLTEILKKIIFSNNYQQQTINKDFDAAHQKKLTSIFLTQLNIPFDRARLDVSAHPFTTTIGNDDVRFTTNYESKGFLSSFFSTVHESGHALYELGLPKGEYKDTVISDAASLGMHESQSRLWENMIARSKPFWTYFFPLWKKMTPDIFKHIDIESWYQLINKIRPSLIRIEADELTYCLHVILRFELELNLIEGKINVSELPQIWNEKMNDFLGITPKNDREGVLQDMHWSGGNFGYFPTYAIGTIYASQLFTQFLKENILAYEEIAHGIFNNILSWLQEHIYQYGRLITADEIIKKTCGEGLNSNVFIAYLKEKYYPLYGI